MTSRLLPALLLLAACPAWAAPTTVGVYAGPGASSDDAAALTEVLGGQEGLVVQPVTRANLVADLAAVDVLVVGGGSGTALGEGFGADGGRALEAFVSRGGGYVGLGAGAYLGARGYNPGSRSVELLDVCLVDRPGWNDRPEAAVELESAAAPLGELPRGGWWFSKGPLFTLARGHGWRPAQPVARFVTDLTPNSRSRAGIMPQTLAIVAGTFGDGRAILFSVSPQQGQPEHHAALARAVRWAGGEGEAAVTEAPALRGELKVALLDDDGAIGGCVLRGFACLDLWQDTRFGARRVSAAQVRAGVLDAYDVLIVSGGSATKQTKALEAAGQDAIRDFVRGGGGYVGICAGAYMAASEPTRYGLGLAKVRCVDTKHWRRGSDQVLDVRATPEFERFSRIAGSELTMYYANGPLLESLPGQDDQVTPLLTFAADLHAKGAPAGVMPGKLAALTSTYGEGRAVVFSIHPELTPKHEGTLARAVLWSAGRALD